MCLSMIIPGVRCSQSSPVYSRPHLPTDARLHWALVLVTIIVVIVAVALINVDNSCNAASGIVYGTIPNVISTVDLPLRNHRNTVQRLCSRHLFIYQTTIGMRIRDASFSFELFSHYTIRQHPKLHHNVLLCMYVSDSDCHLYVRQSH